jgi:hypothetical protein
MLDLSDTQAKILKMFIENYRDKSGNIFQGITRKGVKKYGIEPKTFANHKEYFLKNYFLRLSAVEFHGQRKHFYFQITRFGVLAYLNWASKQPVNEIYLDKNFFPLLMKHWKKFNAIYKDTFLDIYQKSISCLEIDSQYVLSVKGNDSPSDKLTEIMTIPMGIVHVKLFSNYPVLKLQEFPTKISLNETKHFQSLNQNIDDKITERFTFLLCYNLLNTGLTGQFGLMFDHVTSKFLKDDPTEIDLNVVKLEHVKFVEKMKQNTVKLFSLIKKDKELHCLMKSTLSEIAESLANRKSLKTMIEQLD